MRFAVDAHAIGRHLTGNEVYIRSLLNALAAQGRESNVVAYVCSEAARHALSPRIQTRFVSRDPFVRLGLDLTAKVLRDQPDLLHVQYTSPLF